MSSGSPHSHQHQQQQQYSQQNHRIPPRLIMSNANENSVAVSTSAFTSAPHPSTTRSSAPTSGDAVEETQQTTSDADLSKETQQFFYYEYVTADALKDWSGSGLSSIKSRMLQLTGDRENEPEISIIFQELIKSAIDGRQSAFMITRCVIDFIENADTSASGLDLRRIFLQTVNLFEPPDSTTSPSPHLTKILKDMTPRVFTEELLGAYLETSTLIALNIVSPLFPKKAVRVTTALVYKQRKHNLLREETEGFSKLITEFFTASYSSSPLEVVARTGERVKGLIGAFELDPGRVLDILLDTAACTVVSNARFFVRLLKCSAWWPQQLQGTPEDDHQKGREDVKGGKEKEKDREEMKAAKEREKELADREFFEKLEKEGISAFFEQLEAGKGNKVAAQLLGFKFRYYQKEDAREPTPENLMVLSALLIKIGFIDLADLYPHLSPQDDEGMNEVLTSWNKKLEEKHGCGKPNALLMAGALSDDTVPPSRSSKPANHGDEKKVEDTKKDDAPKPKKPDNQKLILLKYLLAVGALPAAMFILGKYPWLPGPSEDISEHLSRVILQSLEGVYHSHRPSLIDQGAKKIVAGQPGKNGSAERTDHPKRRPMVTFTVANLKLKTGDIEYRFFWEEWREGVPICRQPRHVVILMQTLGRMLGMGMGRDSVVISKVCRIGRDVLQDPNCTQADRNAWIGVTRKLLMPVVSMTDGNQGVVNEIWKLLECFPIETRYSMYGEWSMVASKRIPELKSMVATTERKTRDLLKRIHKENVKEMALQLAKVAVSNPVTVMQVVLSQVEGYDNLIECIVDAAKYFTPLGFDAVGFCVLNRYFLFLSSLFR
jgi:THO complex subunit 2